MNKHGLQFSLRWLISVVTFVALILGFYAAFPHVAELVLIVSCLLFGFLGPFFIDYLLKKPWSLALCCFVFGSWLLLVGIFRVGTSLPYFALFSSLFYLFGAIFFLSWL